MLHHWVSALTHVKVQCGAAYDCPDLLDDKALQHEFAVGALQQAALHAVGSGHSEDQHRAGLPYPMRPVHCLSRQKQTHLVLFKRDLVTAEWQLSHTYMMQNDIARGNIKARYVMVSESMV